MSKADKISAPAGLYLWGYSTRAMEERENKKKQILTSYGKT